MFFFARQTQGAQEVGTAEFADALIERLQGGIDLERQRAARREQLERERKQREIRRLLQPLEEMVATGRTPHSVGDVMTRTLITVNESATIDEAMHMMREADVSSVIVEPSEGKEWGILTRRDIVTKIVSANRSTTNTTVADICSRPVFTVSPETSLHDAAEVLTKKGFSRVCVAEGGRIIGIATENDIFNTVEKFGWTAE